MQDKKRYFYFKLIDNKKHKQKNIESLNLTRKVNL